MSPSDWMVSMQQRIGKVRLDLKDRRKSEPITFQGLRRPDRWLFHFSFFFLECMYTPACIPPTPTKKIFGGECAKRANTHTHIPKQTHTNTQTTQFVGGITATGARHVQLRG